MCSVSFDYMSSPNGEMQMMLATFEMKKQDGMKVFLLVYIFSIFIFSIWMLHYHEECDIDNHVLCLDAQRDLTKC